MLQRVAMLLERGDEGGVCRSCLRDQLLLGRIVGAKPFRRRSEAFRLGIDLGLSVRDAEEVLVCGLALAPEMRRRLLLLELILVRDGLEHCIVERGFVTPDGNSDGGAEESDRHCDCEHDAA